MKQAIETANVASDLPAERAEKAAEGVETPRLRADSPLRAMALKAQADRKAGRFVQLP